MKGHLYFLGTDADLLYDNFVRPKIKVGAEWVIKGQNPSQVTKAATTFYIFYPI